MKSRTQVAVGCLVVLLAVAWLDHFTGPEVAFSLFYLFPIGFAAWHAGRPAGLVTALVGALCWGYVDRVAGLNYSSSLVAVWNATMRFCIFVLVVILLSRLREVIEREKLASQTDNLTGLWNRGGFFALLESELARKARAGGVVSLAYIDLDDFKQVNDQKGHREGDQVLVTTASVLRRSVRRGDVVARLGGDEFVLLLSDSDEKAALLACEHIQQALAQAFIDGGWSVRASVGVVCADPQCASADLLLAQADEAMYRAKRSGKNRIASASVRG